MKVTKSQSLSFLILTAAALSGCGSSGVTANPSNISQGQNDVPVIVPIDNGSTGAYPLTFKTVGGSAPVASVPLNTDNLLKVKVTLDQATHNENTPVPTNYTANYTCATVSIMLHVEQNGVYQYLTTVVTGRLSATGSSGCAGSVASQTIDLSPFMTPGHGKIKITAQAITSNANCTAYANGVGSWPYNYGQVCSANPMQSIYQYHVVNGRLEVQVNGTSFGG